MNGEGDSIRLARVETKVDGIQKEISSLVATLILMRREIEERLRQGADKMSLLDTHRVKISYLKEALSFQSKTLWSVIGIQLIQAFAIVWRFIGGGK